MYYQKIFFKCKVIWKEIILFSPVERNNKTYNAIYIFNQSQKTVSKGLFKKKILAGEAHSIKK